jgi:hypothetical protein
LLDALLFFGNAFLFLRTTTLAVLTQTLVEGTWLKMSRYQMPHVHTTSTAFLMTSSDTSQYKAVVPMCR